MAQSWTNWKRSRMSRRQALGLLGGGVVFVGLGAACQSAPPAAPAAKATTAPAVKPAETAKPAAAAPATTPQAKAAAAPPAAAKRGGSLRVGITNDAADLDPHGIPGGVERHILFAIADTLVGLTPDGNLAPLLATSWEPTNELTWIFKLRQGVKFHDGTDFNAKIAKWNYDRMLDTQNKSPRASELLGLRSVDVVDDYTIRFNLEKPFAPLPYILTALPGMMVSPEAVQKAGKDFSRKPVSTGPFMLAEWVKDDHITLRRFDGYWDKDSAGNPLPYLDEIVMRIIPDNAVRLTNLKTGNIDVLNQVAERDVAGLKTDGSVKVLERDTYGFHRLTLHTKRPPFDNKALRQAFAATVDREAIARSLFFGVAKPATGPLTAASWAYDPGFTGPKRDIALAKAKLAEGGQPNGFSFTVEVGARRNDPQVIEAVQAQAADAGIKVQIDAKDFALVVKSLNAHQFDAVYSTFNGNVDPDVMFEMFHSKSDKNWGLYDGGPRLDELLEQGRAIADQSRRVPIYQEIQRIVMDDACMVFIANTTSVDATSTKVQGFVQYPDLAMRFKTVSL